MRSSPIAWRRASPSTRSRSPRRCSTRRSLAGGSGAEGFSGRERTMRLFKGLERTDYQDILRAIGYLCDSNGWHSLRIVECEEGLILQYAEAPDGRDFMTYLFTEEDLDTMLHQAYNRRGETLPREHAGAIETL